MKDLDSIDCFDIFRKMLNELSDEEFCETNFCEPSPIKQASFLPSAKERNERDRKKEELRRRILNTEKECFNVICNSLKLKEDESENAKYQDTNFDILFSPLGRTFFKSWETISRENLQPFLWLDCKSHFYEMSLEEFEFHLMQNLPLDEESADKRKFLNYCLNLLLQETDPLVLRFLVTYLSEQFIPYDIISLNECGGPNVFMIIDLIAKSVLGYSANEAVEIFKQACLASLDQKTYSSTNELRTLITNSLNVFSVQYKVMEQIAWLLELELKPEEVFRIIEVLPIIGLYDDLSLTFAWKILPSILGLSHCHLEGQAVSWNNLVLFLGDNDKRIRNLVPNSYFYFIYILKFIVTRISENDSKSIELLLKIVDNLKLHFCQEKGNMSHYLSMEAVHRLYLICNEKLSSVN